jgi:ferredoxin-NADP reductase
MLFVAILILSVGLALLIVQSIRALLRHWRYTARNESRWQRVSGEQWHAIDACLRQTQMVESVARRPVLWRDLVVARIERESADVKSFYLVDPDGHPLEPCLPGQHVVIQRQATQDFDKDSRCYSLSDDCTAGHWRISVKKQSNTRQSFSRWLHEHVHVGDTIHVRGASGSFFLNSRPQQNVVFVSAGIGITPMIPMLMECIRRNYQSVYFFGQFRDADHMPFGASLIQLATRYSSIHVSVWISRLPQGIRSGNGRVFRMGKFTAGDLLQAVNSNHARGESTEFYVCGPEAWQSQLIRQLEEAGVEKHRIHFERFDSPHSVPAASSPETIARKVVFAHSGASAEFNATHPTLLHCANKNKITMESGCRSGACGACAIRMLEGRVRYTREPQFQTKNNEILPCVCVPETDLVVDA